jgi:hypothetical protein
LSATIAQANVVDFVLVQSQSKVQQTIRLSGPVFAPFGGSINSFPQTTGADKTTVFGHLYVDLQPATIQLLPGSYMTLAPNTAGGYNGVDATPAGSPPGDPLNPGAFAPFDPVIHDPVGPPPQGVTPLSNFGYSFPFSPLNLYATQYHLRWDFTAPPSPNDPGGTPSTPMGFAGNNFNLSGQAMSYTDGRQAFVSGLGNDTSRVDGFPTLFGTNGNDVGTWDGVTLTLPIHSKITFRVTDDNGGIDESVIITGQLVAVPFVPEPSTMTLLGFGVVGLLSYAWRTQRRKDPAV